MLETISVLLGAGSLIYLIALSVVLCIGIIKLMRNWKDSENRRAVNQGRHPDD